ncbi:MAG: carboxymuconolactone decarboxylase family protein [Pseudomonadota bacterium]
MSGRQAAVPLSDGEMSDKQREIASKLRVNGVLPNGFRVGMKNWDLFQAHLPFSTYVMARSTVPPRVREMAIVRIAANNGCDYEFQHHSRVCLNHLGFSQPDIERIVEGPNASGLSELDANVLKMVDQLSSNCNLDDDLYQDLRSEFSEQQFAELMFTIGNYESMTRVINVLDVPMDDDFEIMHQTS